MTQAQDQPLGIALGKPLAGSKYKLETLLKKLSDFKGQKISEFVNSIRILRMKASSLQQLPLLPANQHPRLSVTSFQLLSSLLLLHPTKRLKRFQCHECLKTSGAFPKFRVRRKLPAAMIWMWRKPCQSARKLSEKTKG